MFKRWIPFIAIVAASCAPAAREEVAPVGVTSPLLESLERLVEDGMVVGAVGMVAQDGDVVFRGAAGYANRESNEVLTTDHLFRIASMTKAVTSVAVMILVEEGEVGLDDPVSQFIPGFADLDVLEVGEDGSSRTVPAENTMTVRHLLTHTSGLNYRFIARGPLAEYYTDVSDGLMRTDWDLETQVQRLAAMPLTHEPGAAWTYGLSTDVLGYLVELASNQTLDAFFDERILTPLGMDDTHFFLPEEDWDRLATVYRPDGSGGLEPLSGTVEDGSTIFSVDAVTTGPRVYLSGGGGLVSTAGDYLRFCQMILNGGELDGARILEPETVALMTHNQIGELSVGLEEDKFGLGFSITQQARDGIPRGVVGWGGFYGSEYWIDPEHRIVAVFMSQVYDLPRRSEIVRRFGSAVFQPLASPES
jgi:CubicO group peptidase (beta-lactamase class C family)